MFEVGQRVVCVDNEGTPGRIWRPGCRPSLGAVYTVVRVGKGIRADAKGSWATVWLSELKNSWAGSPKDGVPGHGDIGYFASRFEPLPKKTTSIEVFRRMLTPQEDKANG